MRHTQFLRTCAAAVLLAALAACSEGTGAEEPLNDVYVLTMVDGESDPMVFADYTYPSGTRQVYILAYDSLKFVSSTALSRRLVTATATLGPDGTPIAPIVILRYVYQAQVLRRGNQVIVEYTGSDSDVKPDTFRLRNRNLVKQGPFGANCSDCAPVRSVEYVYGPR